jgi:hypothetical protein
MIRKTRLLQRGFFAAAGILIFLAAGSCTSAPAVHTEKKIFSLVDVINNGKAASMGLAEAPFLFDGEILFLQNQLTFLWQNLYAAGFRLYDAKIIRNETLGEDSYLEFADTMDVKTFFTKYLDGNTSLVEIKALSGSWVFLLDKEDANGYPRIRGFKGGLLVK